MKDPDFWTSHNEVLSWDRKIVFNFCWSLGEPPKNPVSGIKNNNSRYAEILPDRTITMTRLDLAYQKCNNFPQNFLSFWTINCCCLETYSYAPVKKMYHPQSWGVQEDFELCVVGFMQLHVYAWQLHPSANKGNTRICTLVLQFSQRPLSWLVVILQRW